jgi:hypothetical protein
MTRFDRVFTHLTATDLTAADLTGAELATGSYARVEGVPGGPAGWSGATPGIQRRC